MKQDVYHQKIIDFKNDIKDPHYQSTEILQKIENLNQWIKFHALDLPMPSIDLILFVAQDIQQLYQNIWTITSLKQLKTSYQSLQSQTQEIYSFQEIKADWLIRREAQKRQKEFQSYLQSDHLIIDEVKARYENYLKEQHFFVDHIDPPLSWQQIQQMHQSRFLVGEAYTLSQQSFRLIFCPKGQFWMGSENPQAFENQKPKHLLSISEDYFLGQTQVTQKLWTAVMGWNPSHFKGEQLPVENVTWYDCLNFCNHLSRKYDFESCYLMSNLGYFENHIVYANVRWNPQANGFRLPMEAEWEYAAKAGEDQSETSNSQKTCESLKKIAWFHVNSGKKHLDENIWEKLDQKWDLWQKTLKDNQNRTHPVSHKKANAWGIYDMHGNVWEWCMDVWAEKRYQHQNDRSIPSHLIWQEEHHSRVLRGGSYSSNVIGCQSTTRSYDSPEIIYKCNGFRIARTKI